MTAVLSASQGSELLKTALQEVDDYLASTKTFSLTDQQETCKLGYKFDDNWFYRLPSRQGKFYRVPGCERWVSATNGKVKGTPGPGVMYHPLFTTNPSIQNDFKYGYTPSIGLDHRLIDYRTIHRSRIGVQNNSLYVTLGNQKMTDFEKLVHFLVQCIEEEPLGLEEDFYSFALTEHGERVKNLPGADQSGSTIEGLQHPRWHVKVAQRAHAFGLKSIETLMGLSQEEFAMMDIPVRFSQVKLKAMPFMQLTHTPMKRADFWIAVSNRQRPKEKGRSFNFPLTRSPKELEAAAFETRQ